jgi:hypothetical protein
MMDRTQIVLCKCGAIRAAAHEPHCYDDKDWKKTLIRAIKADRRIETIDSKRLSDYTWDCTCEGGK